METNRLRFHVDRREISYLRWIFESYDGMVFISTIDPYHAIIELEISPGCEILVFELIDSLRSQENIQISAVEIQENFSEGLN
jgi:hypothetical protein